MQKPDTKNACNSPLKVGQTLNRLLCGDPPIPGGYPADGILVLSAGLNQKAEIKDKFYAWNKM